MSIIQICRDSLRIKETNELSTYYSNLSDLATYPELIDRIISFNDFDNNSKFRFFITLYKLRILNYLPECNV